MAGYRKIIGIWKPKGNNSCYLETSPALTHYGHIYTKFKFHGTPSIA